MVMQAKESSVQSLRSCQLHVGNGVWDFAREHAAAINAHWQRATALNPNYFNGMIHLIEDLHLDATHLDARLLATDFKSYLYWRDQGYPEARVLDGFGSALLRSRDGAILLGRQRAGNINGGLAYLPGGFIDARDVGADGSVDLAASVSRELVEETGLDVGRLTRAPGFYVTRTQAQISIAAPFTSEQSADELKADIESHIAGDPKSELTDIVVIRTVSDLADLAMPPYAKVLVAELIAPGAKVGA